MWIKSIRRSVNRLSWSNSHREEQEERSHGLMRLQQSDNSVEVEASHHSSCLIRWHGSSISQSSCCLPSLQRWWKNLKFQQFHFLAAGFNIQAPSLNNKHETVSTSDANVIKNDAALAAILLHHADVFPKAGGVIHPVLLRNSSTVWWWGEISVFHHRSIHHNVTHLPVRQDSACFTRCERSLNFQGS